MEVEFSKLMFHHEDFHRKLLIIGQDLQQELVINLDFQINFIGQKETKIPMISIICKIRTKFAIQESKKIKSAANRIKKILDTKCKKANLNKITTFYLQAIKET